jgi:hypothetical protein
MKWHDQMIQINEWFTYVLPLSDILPFIGIPIICDRIIDVQRFHNLASFSFVVSSFEALQLFI